MENIFQLKLKVVESMKGDKLFIEQKCKELNFELIDKNFDYDKNRDRKFYVKCLKCGKVSTKSFTTLVKGGHGCKYCNSNNRNYHNTLKEIMPKIMKSCEDCGYEFLGFVNGEWEKCRTTKLILKCNSCGEISYKNYDNFINKKCKCICNRYKRLYETNVLNIKEVLNKINKVCVKHNFTFVRFASDDGKYHNNKTVLELKCNKCGEKVFYTFNHFTDRKQIVCKYCTKSSLENQLKQKLIEKNIRFEEQKKFDWLIYKNKLSLDFYLPDYNIGIECQGIQHFEPIDFFGGEEAFKLQIERDKIKFELCKTNGIQLKYIINEKEIENFFLK